MSDSLISIIVPMLNEREIVDESLTRLARIVAELDGAWEVIVVDAGSRDGTRERIEDYCARHGWKFRDAADAPRSVGGTVAAGARIATGSHLIVMPADTMICGEAFDELRAAVAKGFHCGGFPKRYVPATSLLSFYAWIQNVARFRWMHNLVWTNGIFFPRGTEIPIAGFLEDVMLSDSLKGPGWIALRTPIAVSARRYYPNHTLRRIWINLSIMFLYRTRSADLPRLRKMYVALAFATLCGLASARPLIFSIVTAFVGKKAGVCGATPVYRKASADGKTCDYGFFTAAHCFQIDMEKRIATFRHITLGENLKKKLRLAPAKAEVLFGPDFQGERPRSRDDEAMVYFSAPCDYVAADDVSRFANDPAHVGDRILTVNQKGEEVAARLTGPAETHDQWQAKLEGKATIEHGDSGSPLWNERGEIVGTLSRKVTAGDAPTPFALSFDPGAVNWAKGTFSGRKQ